MDDDTKSLIFILFISILVVASVYSYLSSMRVGGTGAKFHDLERARNDTTEEVSKTPMILQLGEQGYD